MKILSEYSLGDMSVRYVLAEDGQVGMELYPASMKPFIKEGRRYQVDPLVQWKKEGDAFPYGFTSGKIIDVKILNWPAPSIIAASSNSSGVDLIKP